MTNSPKSFRLIKDIFLSFYDFQEFFTLCGNNFILKSNEFHSPEKFKKFRLCFQKLNDGGFIRPLSGDQTCILLFTNGEFHTQFKMAPVQRLTGKGLSMMEILPVREELISVGYPK